MDNNKVVNVGSDFLAPSFNTNVNIAGIYNEKSSNSIVRYNEGTAIDNFAAFNATEFTTQTMTFEDNNSFSKMELGMVSFWLNGITGVTGVDLGDALLWTIDRIASPSVEESPMLNYPELLQIATQHSEGLIERELIPWRQKNQRQLQRDEQRISDYYENIIREIKGRIKKRKLSVEEKERENNRIEATKLELKRKIKDLHERSSMQVNAQLHSALIVWLQTVHLNCQLIRKKQKREVVAVWNPYHKQVEPLRCEQSNLTVKNFYLTDESAQIICPQFLLQNQN